MGLAQACAYLPPCPQKLSQLASPHLIRPKATIRTRLKLLQMGPPRCACLCVFARGRLIVIADQVQTFTPFAYICNLCFRLELDVCRVRQAQQNFVDHVTTCSWLFCKSPCIAVNFLCCATPLPASVHAACNLQRRAGLFQFRLPASRMSCSSSCLPNKTPRAFLMRLTPPPRPHRTPAPSRLASHQSALPQPPRQPQSPSVKTMSPPSLLGQGPVTGAGKNETGLMAVGKMQADLSR